MRLQKTLTSIIQLFLLAPFLILIIKFPMKMDFDIQEFIWAFKNTIYQAVISGVLSLLLGTWVALGLLRLQGRWRRSAEVLCLLPNFLPPIFTLLIVLDSINPFPIGIVGIAIVHSIMNFGLVALGLANSAEEKIGGMAELAQIEGSSRWRFLRRVFFPLLKFDYYIWFLFVFSICFASFSVPLIVGGQRGTTLEVLIYEKIRLSLEWGSAVLLSLIQLAVMGLLSYLLIKESRSFLRRSRAVPWLGSWSGVIVIVLFFIFYVLGYVESVYQGILSWDQISPIWGAFTGATLGTLVVGITTGVITLLSFALFAYLHEAAPLSRFMRMYIAPSTTLAGFAILVTGSNEGVMSLIKISVGLLLLFIGPLYRMSWESDVQLIQGQVETAKVLGANSTMIYKNIVWPQVKFKAFLLAGLASAWACGDFALSRILAYKDITLALLTETLMSTYRLNLANLLSFAILLSSGLCFFFFWGWAYVGRRKLS